MRLLLTICLMGFGTIVFGQEGSTKEVMEQWLLQNFNFTLPDTLEFETTIDPKNYAQFLPLDVIEELKKDEWQGEFKLADVESVEDGLTIMLDDEYSFRMLLMENYILVSFHGIMGDYKQTLVYNFESKELLTTHDYYALRPLGKSEISVTVDYYDSRDIEDPDYEGHIFEFGSVDLTSGEYTLLGKD